MSRFTVSTLVALLTLVFFCSMVSADEIILKDGRKVEGEIVFQDAKTVKIKTKFGEIEFPMADVEKIEKKKTVDQLYKEKVEATNPRDAALLMELVKWCKENNLQSKARTHLNQIISLDANHEEARGMLGYVKHEGQWVTAREKQKMEDDAARSEKEAAGLVEYKGEWLPEEDVDKLKKGLVRHEGQWVTAEEKERLDKNLVLFEGQWIPKEDAEKRKQGLFKVNGAWVSKQEADLAHSSWETPWRVESEHTLIVTNLPHDKAQLFLAESEGAYKRAKSIFEVEPDLSEAKLILYIASDLDTYSELGVQYGDEKSSYYGVFYSEAAPEAAPVSVGYYAINDQYAVGLVKHGVIEQFLRRLELKEPLPDWFVKGQASKEERFWDPRLVSWSKQQIIRLGGPFKLKQFFGGFGFTEREILNAGLVCAFLESPDAPESVADKVADLKKAVKTNKKIEVAFGKLETALVRSEKPYLGFYDKFK